MSYTYTFNGTVHTMSDAEAEAIERSGQPHRVQDYALGMVRVCFGDHTPGSLKIGVLLMDERPGQTEPGEFPIQPPHKKRPLGRWASMHRFHCADRFRGFKPACGIRSYSLDDVLPVKAFRAAALDMPICQKCAKVVADWPAAGKSYAKKCNRQKMEIVAWTDEQAKALKDWRRAVVLGAPEPRKHRKRKPNYLLGW